jgi:hypothetical protein
MPYVICVRGWHLRLAFADTSAVFDVEPVFFGNQEIFRKRYFVIFGFYRIAAHREVAEIKIA